MTRKYTYIPVSGKFFCVQDSLLLIVWIFLVKHKKLHLASLGIRQRQLPAILKRIIRYRLQRQPAHAGTITLSVGGNFCIPVHRGYKVFNFSRMTATKIFYPEADRTAIAYEIKSVSDASSLEFAPRLLETDSQGRWYTESFVPGTRSLKTEQSDPVALFERIVAVQLSAIILSKPVHTVNLNSHLRELCNTMDRLLEESQLDDAVSAGIISLVKSASGNLEANNDTQIQIAFTHGDFSFVNFLYTNGSIAVIDWESAMRRSILHDLYNYFFTEIYYERIPAKRFSGFKNAIRFLNQSLASNRPALPADLADLEDVYRRLYYLERIIMLLERESSTGQQNVIQRSLDIFNAHEEHGPDHSEK